VSNVSREAEKYFDVVSGRWDVLRKSFYGDEVRDAVLSAANIQPNDTVLDVGAGTGFLTEGAVKIAQNVVALDFSEAMMCEARTKLRRRNVEFKIGNVEHIPLPDGSVNAVIGNMILHHCLNPEMAIRDMARVLVLGGRLALSDLQQHNYEFLREEHADRWLGFEFDRVRSMMDKAAFEDIRVDPLESCCSTTAEHGQVKIPMFLASGRKRQE
jgi:ubiquinone/menaquinone biosynthesis C-methylase UbiE